MPRDHHRSSRRHRRDRRDRNRSRSKDRRRHKRRDKFESTKPIDPRDNESRSRSRSW